MKLESHKKASLVKLLAVDDFPLHGGSLVHGGDFDLVARLPTMGGADANALGTQIIRVRFLFDFAGFGR